MAEKILVDERLGRNYIIVKVARHAGKEDCNVFSQICLFASILKMAAKNASRFIANSVFKVILKMISSLYCAISALQFL